MTYFSERCKVYYRVISRIGFSQTMFKGWNVYGLVAILRVSYGSILVILLRGNHAFPSFNHEKNLGVVAQFFRVHKLSQTD